MAENKSLVRAVAAAARLWRVPEYPRRAEAVDRTLGLDNRFTEEAVAYAVNQQMHELSPSKLESWSGAGVAEDPAPGTREEGRPSLSVGVLNAANVPLVGLQDFLAVMLTGHRYLGVLSSRSPYLLPAFAEEVRAAGGVVPAKFVETDEMFADADAVIATGSNDTRDWVYEQCEIAAIAPERRLVRGNRYSVAVMDGDETEDELESLAEDVLLHEGLGCRNVAIIWAPAGSMPDRLLSAFAQFRAVFPAHPATPGSLTMQKAFLEAIGKPHAYGEGLEFLMSRGDPEVQPPGHVRWVEYGRLEEATRWISAHRDEIQLVAAHDRLLPMLDVGVGRTLLGTTQRPPLNWCADGQDVVQFLKGLRAGG